MSDMAYIARKSCGCLVAAAVDRPEYAKENAKEIASWVRGGYTVERMTVEEVRAAEWKCPHEVAPAAPTNQLALDT